MVDWTKYIGIPFVKKGRSIEGCDCWGLVYLFHKLERDLTIPSYLESYVTTEDKEAISRVIENQKSLWISLQEPEEGSVALFDRGGLLCHVGLVVNKRTFIHTEKGYNTHLNKFSDIFWQGKLEGFYKYAP